MFKLMEQYFPAFLLALLAVGWIAGGFWFAFSTSPRTIVYDCRLSEISPDFPTEVKEQCRKLRASGRI